METTRILNMFRKIGKGIYSLIRFSRFYSIYLRLFRKSIFKLNLSEKTFYKGLFGYRGVLVFDIGANVGDKASLFSSLGQKVVAIDPDQANYRLLKRRFFFSRNVRIVNCAIGAAEGKENFYISSEGSSINTLSKKWKSILETPSLNRWSSETGFQLSYEVDVQTLESIITKYGTPYFVKIDVEGYELEVLKGLKSMIPVMTIEANFPEFRDETIACINKLVDINNNARFNCVDGHHLYIMKDHMNGGEIIDWLKATEMRYFELVCLNE